ncbi:uncharacterized protein TRAVEDRAFT_133234 [Trametes versicolor FP-101664 SS1]|uniref:uncharacterized protein n=1 Tax=Trametes versicolor (strain FP-101664) TaxID=717944 RepID=UPI0004623490|nr:uncharacterized protein TRAVEDRAFT_133234 [Trametes versicolor FP-101664 SS1]EIW53257.1 hypothetical protein TRAVEDRAFT_133234 [Trametes versicolor FP-101664 SS1]
MSSKLSPQARRWRTIMFTLPIMGVTSFVLYKRLVLGEPRRVLPTDLDKHGSEKVASIYTAGEGKGEQEGGGSKGV